MNPPRPREPIRTWVQAIGDLEQSRRAHEHQVQAQAQNQDQDHYHYTYEHPHPQHRINMDDNVDTSPNSSSSRNRSESNVSNSSHLSRGSQSSSLGSGVPSLIAHDEQVVGHHISEQDRQSGSSGFMREGNDRFGRSTDVGGQELMTPPTPDGGYFDLIRARRTDDGSMGDTDGPLGLGEWGERSISREDGFDYKGKGREPEVFPRLWNEIHPPSPSYPDTRVSETQTQTQTQTHPLNPQDPSSMGPRMGPTTSLVDRTETRTLNTLFVTRETSGSSWVYTRPGTPSTMRAGGGMMTTTLGTTGRNTPIRYPSPGPSPNEGSGSFLRPQMSGGLTPTTTTTLPEWLRSRSRSSSSISVLSKTSQSTGSGSIKSLSGRLKMGMKSRLSFKDKDQAASGLSGSSALGSAFVVVGIDGNKSKGMSNRPEGKEKKDGPKGLMRRLMVRSKTSPLVVTTIHHHPIGHDITSQGRTLRDDLPFRADGKDESMMIVVPRPSESESMDMNRTRRAGGKGMVVLAREERASVTVLQTPLAGTMVMKQVSAPTPSSFETKLPRELRLLIFRSLIDLHVAEYETLMKRGKWKGVVAQQRWYGETAGRRELFRLRSVSTSWNDLAMDGQLWQDCDMHAYLGHMPPSVLVKLLWSSSSCVRKLDAYGWYGLPGSSLINALSGSGRTETSLRKLDLQGCRNMAQGDITWLLDGSPQLSWLSLKGLAAVDETHWDRIMSLPFLEYLDVSYCKRILPSAIPRAFLTTQITHLLAAGIGGQIRIGQLAPRMPNLQVLDLSHSPTLADWDVQSFLAPAMDEWKPVWTRLSVHGHRGSRVDEGMVFLTEEQAGQQPSITGFEFVPRRVTRLKKLVLSECPSLTDQTCRYLAHALPLLEIFEMAHADGHPEIRSAGLVAMLSTCPKIRKIDLEGAVEIGDEVLSALTPQDSKTKNAVGSYLEVLSIGFADEISMDAMLQLVRRCPRLRQLDVDNTNATDLLVKEFVRKRGPGTALSVVDCRGVSRNVVEALESRTRPRDGWRGWQAAPLKYNDGFKVGKARDECTQAPVVQSFWTWNSVPRAERPGYTSHGRRDGSALTSIEMDALDGHYDRSCVIM